MDLESLALAVDERVRVPAADRGAARLYAVHLREGDTAAEGDPWQPELELLARGEPRRIPRRVNPPAGAVAIALATAAWAAPMEDDGTVSVPPSEHPRRRRVHLTALVAGEGAEAVSVLRDGDGEPVVLRDGVGLVHDRLVRCWQRRGEPPPAPPVVAGHGIRKRGGAGRRR